MRFGALLAVFFLLLSPVKAQEKVTVEQLTARLSGAQTRKDKSVAGKLQDVRLTERLDAVRLASLLTLLPGDQSRAALSALSDESAFLAPPAALIPSDPPPSAQEQQRMAAALVEAMGHPDVPQAMFDVTRTLTRYRNFKYVWGGHQESIPIVTPLPLLKTRSIDTLSYRMGQTTVSDQATHTRFSEHVDNGAEDWDGMRDLLKDLASDLRQTQPEWLRWEREGAQVLAALRFSVTQEHSMLALQKILPATVNARWIEHPSYECEVAIEPKSGQVYRLILHTKPAAKWLTRADASVEFAPVAVAGGALLPARAVLWANAQTWVGSTGGYEGLLQWSSLTEQYGMLDHIAEIEFSNYRDAAGEKPLSIANRKAVWAMLNAKPGRVTLDQLDQLVSAGAASSDAELAERLRAVELTQRLDEAHYARLAAHLPGKSSATALATLRDLAEFEDPSPGDIPAAKPIDAKAQGAILHSAVDFVADVVRKLPDLFATRQLDRYEDLFAARGIVNPEVAVNKPFALIDESTGSVKVRSDREVVETATKTYPKAAQGLDTWGGFGPMLETVMADILRGKIGWSRWETGPTGTVAVFRYAVPEPVAHYDVRFCCYMGQDGVPGQYSATPGYHGEIAIDPRTGAVLRLVIRTDLEGEASPFDNGVPAPLKRSDVVIEYGPVTIGGQQYICPMRMVSVMTFWTLGLNGPLKKFVAPDVSRRNAEKAMRELEHSRVTAINEASFSDYHVFRTEMRIVSESK